MSITWFEYFDNEAARLEDVLAAVRAVAHSADTMLKFQRKIAGHIYPEPQFVQKAGLLSVVEHWEGGCPEGKANFIETHNLRPPEPPKRRYRVLHREKPHPADDWRGISRLHHRCAPTIGVKVEGNSSDQFEVVDDELFDRMLPQLLSAEGVACISAAHRIRFDSIERL